MNTHSRSIVNAPLLLALVASLLGGALTFTPAHATTGEIHVNSATDELAANGTCSLREAIFNANTNTSATYPECAPGGFPASDNIYFDGNYTITLDPLLGTLNPSSDMYFWGNGVANSIIQASTCDPTPTVPGCTIATYPVFSVTGGTISFYSLTVQHGATGAGGGGIYNNGGEIAMNYSLISRNYAASGGGGVYNQSGGFSVYQSTIDHNVAPGGGGGGGLYNQDSMWLYRSTISYNTAVAALAGGLNNPAGSVLIGNSTFAYNSAGAVGALYNTASASVTNSTFSYNTDFSVTYGGIVNDSSGSLSLKNSLLANNDGVDCSNSGTLTGDVNNLIEFNVSCGTPSVTSDPGTLTWGLNGGQDTNTLAIDASSSAFEAGDLSTCNTPPVSGYDQRGFYRKALTCDIGAFEFHLAAANDEYAAASTISSLPYSDSIDTVAATTGTSPADPAITCIGIPTFRSVWYAYTPAVSGVLAVNTFGTNYDTALEVWEGGPGTTSVGCNDDSENEVSYQSSVVFPVTASTTYTIEVTSHSGFGGTLLLNVFTRPIRTAGVTDGGWFFLRNANSAGAADLTFQYGWAGPVALVGDWNADGSSTVGIDDASWFFLKDSNSPGPADNVFQYGWAGPAPLMGDWDANGTETVGIYNSGTFFLRNSNSAGAADSTFGFGWAGATPLAGDWNGNGTTTIGIYDSSTGTFFLRDGNTSGGADYTFSFGPPGAKPVVGDWDGDGLTTIGVFSGGNFYLRNSNTPGSADVTFPYAWSTATPVMGDWDGL